MVSTTRLPPYVMVGGRTRPTREVAIELLVEQRAGDRPRAAHRFEAARILAATRCAISVAELSNQLGVPLGATMVLVSDLLDAGDLIMHDTVEQSPISDHEIMTRIIHRVREL